jgi:hypothetical protein
MTALGFPAEQTQLSPTCRKKEDFRVSRVGFGVLFQRHVTDRQIHCRLGRDPLHPVTVDIVVIYYLTRPPKHS